MIAVDLMINNADVKAAGNATFERLNPMTGRGRRARRRVERRGRRARGGCGGGRIPGLVGDGTGAHAARSSTRPRT